MRTGSYAHLFALITFNILMWLLDLLLLDIVV